jgi:hypothetical protein
MSISFESLILRNVDLYSTLIELPVPINTLATLWAKAPSTKVILNVKMMASVWGK